jgi:hypothetical protein
VSSGRSPRRICPAWILAALVCSCAPATRQADPQGPFSIYLVTDPVSGQEAMELDLGELELAEVPILSLDDIQSYSWQTHEIQLTESARERIAALEVPVTTGVPFVVCVGDERVYGGAFWISWSSISFNGIVIDTFCASMEGQPIRIQLGYPRPDFFEGQDPRSDPRIQQSLSQAGRLR